MSGGGELWARARAVPLRHEQEHTSVVVGLDAPEQELVAREVVVAKVVLFA